MSVARTAAQESTEKHPVDRMLPVPQLFLYGLQHVMSMYAGVVAVPLIVGTALGLPFAALAYLPTAALLLSGPWIITMMTDYMRRLITSIPTLVG